MHALRSQKRLKLRGRRCVLRTYRVVYVSVAVHTRLRFDSPDVRVVRVSLSVEHLVPPRSLAAQEAAARFADVQHDSTHYQEPRTGHSRPKIPQRQENQCGVCPFTCFAAQTRPRTRYAERLRGHGRQREP